MYTIIDLSRLLPGPYATLCLQGLGMDVLKVEEPRVGDYLRYYGPRRDGVSTWFEALNRGKRSVCLDLRRAPDRDALMGLLPHADVLVESFRPGVLARLGLDPAVLVEAFPRLVVASLTGWGQAGPLSHLPGHDLGFVSLAGVLSEDPRVPRIQWGDLAGGGLAAALRIAGALLHRERTGRGAWLDIAMLDGLVGLQPMRFADLVAGAPPDEGLTGTLPQYGLYRCADGRYVSVAALEPPFLARLQAEAGDVRRETLERFFASAPRDAWLARLGEACVVPVLDLAEVASHPQVAPRGLFSAEGYAHPPTGPVYGRAPALGEHDREVLGRGLGGEGSP